MRPTQSMGSLAVARPLTSDVARGGSGGRALPAPNERVHRTPAPRQVEVERLVVEDVGAQSPFDAAASFAAPPIGRNGAVPHPATANGHSLVARLPVPSPHASNGVNTSVGGGSRPRTPGQAHVLEGASASVELRAMAPSSPNSSLPNIASTSHPGAGGGGYSTFSPYDENQRLRRELHIVRKRYRQLEAELNRKRGQPPTSEERILSAYGRMEAASGLSPSSVDDEAPHTSEAHAAELAALRADFEARLAGSESSHVSERKRLARQMEEEAQQAARQIGRAHV